MKKSRSNKKNFLLAIVIVLIIISIIIVGLFTPSTTDTESDKTLKIGTVYNFKNKDGSNPAELEIVNVSESGLVTFNFAFIINHNVTNNGFCQSNDPDYCDKQTNKDIENIKYRYGVTFAESEDTDNLIATVYDPIYCNLDKAKADPLDIGYEGVDIACNGWTVSNWKPTEWFVAKNTSSTRDFDSLLSGITLNIYDIADEFSLTVEYGGTTITSGRLDYSDITSNTLIDSFSFEYVK